MVELSYGGAWFKWSSLGPRDKKLALISTVSSCLAVLPIALMVGDWAFGIGFRAGSGGQQPPVTSLGAFIDAGGLRWIVVVSFLLAVVSGITWWQFSKNQDEMFNRIQNFAIGQAAAWTFAATFVCWLLELGGWVEPIPLAAIVAMGFVLILGFWFYAVRRWA